MKNIVLFLILGLFSTTSSVVGQVQKRQNYMSDIDEILDITEIHVDRLGASYDWRLSNPACNGCGSFYYAITRTAYSDDDGKYWFYLIMQSNSIYGNGVLASSYVQDINVNVILSDGEDVHVLGPFYILVKPPQATFVESIWSIEPDIVIEVTWGSVTAY